MQVIADALSAGARVALLAGTGSELGPAVADSAKRLLGPDLTQRVQIFHFSLQGGKVAVLTACAGTGTAG